MDNESRPPAGMAPTHGPLAAGDADSSADVAGDVALEELLRGDRRQPPVAYSQLYQWIEQGKVESVVLDGEVVSTPP